MADIPELRMNEAALKRVDPYGKEIIETGTHVALYTFKSDTNEWEKTDIEGALFVYSRVGEPYFSILIMNRLNTNNLIEPLIQGIDLQLQEPFLLYRNNRGEIYGIWFYDKRECIKIAAVMTHLAHKDELQQKLTVSSSLPSVNNENCFSGGDIFCLLNKAKSDLNTDESETKPDTSGLKLLFSRSDEKPPQSVMEFFARASGGASTFPNAKCPSVVIGKPQISVSNVVTGNTNKDLFDLIKSNPAHSVQHIEKQQRSFTPNSETERYPKSKAVLQRSSKSRGSSDCLPLRHQPDVCKQQLSTSEQLLKYVENNQHPVRVVKTREPSESFLRITSPNTAAATYITPIDSVQLSNSSDQRSLSAPLCGAETPQKPALMPPTMFTLSSQKQQDIQGILRSTPTTPICTQRLENSVNIVGQYEDHVEMTKLEPLTKNQFLQAFTFILKNDSDLLSKLHNAYVKSFNEALHHQ